MNSLITYGTCAFVCLGLFLVFRDKILFLIKSIFYSSKSGHGIDIRKNKVSTHLQRIMQIVSNGKNIKGKVTVFVIGSILILVLMGTIMFREFELKGLILALLMALMPYGYLRTKLYVKQVTGSFEGEMLIDELLNQYKMCGGDIYEAIDKCVISLNHDTLSKKALFHLTLKLHSYSGEKELVEALNDFVANWNTVWARMLADNIYNAVKENVNVIHGLENILIACKDINKFIEENKKDGLETEVVVKILCPLFFIVLLFMAKEMMGYTWGTLLKYEFMERGGLMIFSALVFLSGLNLIVLPVLGKQKYDF